MKKRKEIIPYNTMLLNKNNRDNERREGGTKLDNGLPNRRKLRGAG